VTKVPTTSFPPTLPCATGASSGLISIPPGPRIEVIRDIRENGAYPKSSGTAWFANPGPLSSVIRSYFGRILLGAGEGRRPELSGVFLLPSASDYHQAIAAIEGRGGGYVGMGPTHAFAFPAWQGASSAYLLDSGGMTTIGYAPLIGTLLCMAKTRVEFLSLISGKPVADIPRRPSQAPGGTIELFRQIASIELDYAFSNIVENCISGAIYPAERFPGGPAVKSAMAGWLKGCRDTFRSSESQAEHRDLSLFFYSDPGGRGGLLSSERAYNLQRDFFLNDRLIGVPWGVLGGGLEAVAASLAHDREKASVIFLGEEPAIEQRLGEITASLVRLPGVDDSIVIFHGIDGGTRAAGFSEFIEWTRLRPPSAP
jgi:hypothetical protein